MLGDLEQAATAESDGRTDDTLDPFHDHVDEAAGLLANLHLLNSSQVAREISALRTHAQTQLFVAFAILIVGSLFAWVLARRVGRSITVPLAELETAVGRFGSDELYSHRIAVSGDDELARLGSAFNTMAGTLERSTNDLQYQAVHDALTGLPNRVLLRERLDHAVARAARDRTMMALLVLDLDGFKNVNDTFGHAVGDELLVAVAGRIERCLRPGDIVARLGGDEFAVLSESLSGFEIAVEVAERIGATLQRPFDISGTRIMVSSSIGIVNSLGDRPAKDLLRDADLAMYEAKAMGTGTMTVYEPAMHTAVAKRVHLEAGLRTAVAQREVTLMYQPIVELDTGAMVAAEALIRWNHPELGLLGPAEFIPIAEATGLIVPIGAWVLTEACRQLAAWHARYPAERGLAVSVNVSARQLLDPTLVDCVRTTLDETSLNPGLLILEVSETTVVQDMELAIQVLGELKRLGVRIALDDFGIGASSLGNLSRFPIDIVKIDKSFVDNVPESALATSLADAISEVVSALQMQSVVEGVERAEQRDRLVVAGFELGQGFYFARPLDPAQLEAMLRAAPVLERAGAWKGTSQPAPTTTAQPSGP